VSIYKPSGNFKNEVVDPDRLSSEWLEAQRIINNATNWQFCSEKNNGLTVSELAGMGNAVEIKQIQKSGYADAGKQGGTAHKDAEGIHSEHNARVYDNWLIPYKRGYQELWDGKFKINWTSTSTELVLIGFSYWMYRLSANGESANHGGRDEALKDYWDAATIRIKSGVKLDGSLINGSGPGVNVTTKSQDILDGAGSNEKGICSSSSSIQLVSAGTHELVGVAGQAPATAKNRTSYYRISPIEYNLTSNLTDYTPDTGVAVINARMHIIRFPRGRMFGA
tara:strand:+ start:2958 stop:3797 length:840 start_codon:yes stop_codon:yes gene_type:complete